MSMAANAPIGMCNQQFMRNMVMAANPNAPIRHWYVR